MNRRVISVTRAPLARASQRPQRVRAATRAAERSQVVAMMAPRRTTCPVEPPEIQSSIRVTKAVQITVPVAGSAVPVSIADLMAGVPGGLTYWSRVRLQTVRVWGDSGTASTSSNVSPLTVVNQSGLAGTEPPITWVDSGTPGQRRPAIAFQSGLITQANWYGVADASPQFTVQGGSGVGSGTSLVVQAVVELMSP